MNVDTCLFMVSFRLRLRSSAYAGFMACSLLLGKGRLWLRIWSGASQQPSTLFFEIIVVVHQFHKCSSSIDKAILSSCLVLIKMLSFICILISHGWIVTAEAGSHCLQCVDWFQVASLVTLNRRIHVDFAESLQSVHLAVVVIRWTVCLVVPVWSGWIFLDKVFV